MYFLTDNYGFEIANGTLTEMLKYYKICKLALARVEIGRYSKKGWKVIK